MKKNILEIIIVLITTTILSSCTTDNPSTHRFKKLETKGIIIQQKNRRKEIQKNIIIDADFFRTNVYSKKLKKITNAAKYQLEIFTNLKNGETQFSYYYKPIYETKEYNLLMIFADYETEVIAWLATYDKQHTFKSAVQVFYDNAEGAFLTTSKLHLSVNTITATITEHNDFEEPSRVDITTKYILNKEGIFTTSKYPNKEINN